MPSDVIAQTVQGTAISAASNVLAQVIASYKHNTPFSLNLAPVIKFALFSIISCPPNIAWQTFLEDHFPTNIHSPKVPAKPASISEKPRSAYQPESRISKTNVIIKFVLDMTIGAVINNLLFLVFMGYVNAPVTAKGLEGPWAGIWRDVEQRFWPLMKDGLKLWPFVSLMSFLFVPVNRRLLLGALVGVGWNIYLSLLVGS